LVFFDLKWLKWLEWLEWQGPETFFNLAHIAIMDHNEQKSKT